MRKIIFSLFFICFSCLLFAQISSSKASEYYTQKKYQAALQEYFNLPENADTYYNIGNCYYKLGDYGKAILFYHRALRLNPNSWQILKNLQIAEKTLLDKPVELTKMEKLWEQADRLLSLNALALLILALLFIMCVFWIVAVYKPRIRYLSFLSLLVCLAFGYFAFQKHEAMKSEAVLIADEATGYSGPAEDFKTVFTIHEGNFFTVLEQDGLWSKIKLKQGFVAWIKSENLEKI